MKSSTPISRIWSAAVAVLWCSVACSQQLDSSDEFELAAEDAANSSDRSDTPRLVGGTFVGRSEFNGVGFVENSCTVARVGPRHLALAAHCIGRRVFERARIVVNFSRPNLPRRFTRVVQRIWQDPNWRPTSSSVSDLAYTRGSDFAVVLLDQALPAEVPVVPISNAMVHAGDVVALVGAGCEQGFFGPSTWWRLKSNTTRVLDMPDIGRDAFLPKLDTQVGWSSNDWKRFSLFAFPTPGLRHPSLSTGASSVCFGDSGGPVLRDTGEGWVLVGIHGSYARAENDRTGNTVFNFHARVDMFEQELAELGVAMIQSDE